MAHCAGAHAAPALSAATSDSTPKATITRPEATFTQRNRRDVTQRRSRAPALASTHHHAAEPLKTPATRASDATGEPASSALIPRPAKIAPNDKIVIGLLSVRPSVEPYAPSQPNRGK